MVNAGFYSPQMACFFMEFSQVLISRNEDNKSNINN